MSGVEEGGKGRGKEGGKRERGREGKRERGREEEERRSGRRDKIIWIGGKEENDRGKEKVGMAKNGRRK